MFWGWVASYYWIGFHSVCMVLCIALFFAIVSTEGKGEGTKGTGDVGQRGKEDTQNVWKPPRERN